MPAPSPRAPRAPRVARPTRKPQERRCVAFALGGGGHLGAHEVGMLRALLESGIRPDLVVGTSVGALNGAAVAADPSPDQVDRLVATWGRIEATGLFGGSVVRRLHTLARSRTHLHDPGPLRDVLRATLPERFEDLPVHFECVAASIERAAEHWFDSGPLVPAILASTAVPGILPPVEVDGEHFVDGGIVNSIPVGRAVQLGADLVFVLQVGRVETPLSPPRWPWEAGLLAFEIARRHRFAAEMAALPDRVEVHVLPTGAADRIRYNDLAQLRFSDYSRVRERIDSAYAASAGYLAEHGFGAPS